MLSRKKPIIFAIEKNNHFSCFHEKNIIFAIEKKNLFLAFYYRTLFKILYIDIAIIALFSMAWIFGITSTHFQQDVLVILFLVTHLLLAVTIFGLRCFMDDQVSFLNLFWIYLLFLFSKPASMYSFFLL